MSRKAKHEYETKIEIVKAYKRGEGSFEVIGKKYGLGRNTVYEMVKKI